MTIATPPAGVRYGPGGSPKHTLGPQIFLWVKKNLLQPDGPNAGEPLKLTPEQVRFLAWWYAVDDRGRFVYRTGVYRRLKGAGKTPFAAVLCCVEFLGPCRCGGFKDGQPVGIEHPAAWVQGAAVSKDQTRNLFTLFPAMLSPACIEAHQVDLGKEIIYAHKGARRLEAVTSSPRALEGGRATFIVKDENHHWIKSNEGLDMSAVIARNAAKSRDGSSRVLATTNAFAPGEGSDAENDWEAFRLAPDGMIYDSIEAPEDAAEALRELKAGADDPELRRRLREGLEYARGDSHWLDIDRLMAEILDPRTSETMARRYYLNQIAAGEDRAFDRAKWDSLARPDYRVGPGSLIVLGFDGSKNRDWTALVGTEVATGFQWPIGIWKPRLSDGGDIEIPELEVDAAVEATFERYDVWRMNGDPFWWESWLRTWAGRYNKPGHEVVVSYNTTQYRKMAVALLAFRNAIQEGSLSHDGNPDLADAIGNAHKHQQGFVDDNGDHMWTIQKDRPDSPFKIDPAMAACLSWDAYLAAKAAGAEATQPYVYERRGVRRL